jgi:pimeloyl-ACP methyl ester carboxylesterase
MQMIRKRYLTSGNQQIHLRESGWDAGGNPLVCLHATAYSSRSFEALMQAVGARRHVIALDLPGYGESDAPVEALEIAGYARMLLAALNLPCIDLLGYHTGAAIACEMALIDASRVGHLTLMGIPHFRALDFDRWKAHLCAVHRLEPELDQFTERWSYLVANRPEGLSLRRGFENFVDELKAWPDGVRAHQALFAYDLEAALARLDCRVTVLNPAGHLAEASRQAAALIADVNTIELPELRGAVLDCAAPILAQLICQERG